MVGRAKASGPLHVLDNDVGRAGNESREVAGDQPRAGVDPAPGREAADDRDRLAGEVVLGGGRVRRATEQERRGNERQQSPMGWRT